MKERVNLKMTKKNKVKLPKVKRRTVLKEVKSGEIVIEEGGDGVWLRFECSCEDAIPFCRSACCGLYGIDVEEGEIVTVQKAAKKQNIHLPVVPNTDDGTYEMQRSSDSWCCCLDRETRGCKIYDARPQTCREYHCTQRHDARGWKLDWSRFEFGEED